MQLTLHDAPALRPYQTEALERWQRAGSLGVVELPTGAGKTMLAVHAIAATQRSTLVVVPTIDLLVQWQAVLQRYLRCEVGMVGGGSRELKPITVTTYDSAAAQMEFFGHRFGFLICDECHHLPAPGYQFVAAGSIAPFRLGLSATLERADGQHSRALELLGPLVHRISITELRGEYLATYEVVPVLVELDDEEREAYEAARGLYIDFIRMNGIKLGDGQSWAKFIQLAHRNEIGRQAFQAYREQKKIALTSRAKQAALWRILLAHKNDRVLVFCGDNETVYYLAHQYLGGAITHHTKAEERKLLLQAFSAGELKLLFTAKVLNEGVDVPEANVGVILAGSGSVREHVQRLGRILRKQPDKQAVLYEVFTNVAAELGIRERRTQHDAYGEG